MSLILSGNGDILTLSENSILASPLGTSSGASLVGYMPAGVGAVATDVQGKLRESVSVKDFGAVGDGVVNDTSAIQAAVNSGAGAVYFPKGNYKITSAISMPCRVSLHGDGGMASIIHAYSCDGLLFSATGYSTDNTFVENFGLLGFGGGNYTAINSPLGLGTKYGLHFSGLNITDFNQGIILDNNLHCSASKCHIEYVNNPLKLGDISTLTHISVNTIISSGGNRNAGSTAESIAIDIQGGSNCEAVKISDNLIYGFGKGINIATTTDLNITGNGVDACMLYGIYFVAVQHNFNIKNNFIELLGASAVAGVFGAPVASEYISQINIEGNTFTVMGAGGCECVRSCHKQPNRHRAIPCTRCWKRV